MSLHPAIEDARQDALLLFLQEGVLAPEPLRLHGRAGACFLTTAASRRREWGAFLDLHAIENADAPHRPVNEYEESRRRISRASELRRPKRDRKVEKRAYYLRRKAERKLRVEG